MNNRHTVFYISIPESLKIYSVNVDNADLVGFTGKILNGKLHFLCSEVLIFPIEINVRNMFSMFLIIFSTSYLTTKNTWEKRGFNTSEKHLLIFKYNIEVPSSNRVETVMGII